MSVPDRLYLSFRTDEVGSVLIYKSSPEPFSGSFEFQRKTPCGLMPKFTKRQIEICKLFADGKTSWEVGKILGISENVADKDMQKVTKALDVYTKIQAIAKMIREGVI